MKELQREIQTGDFRQVYLLYGEERFLVQQYKHRLVEALNPDGDTMNMASYEGKQIDIGQMLQLADTLPFLSQKRILLVENSGFFKNKCDALADYLKQVPEYLYMVFVEEQVDKRSRVYKGLGKIGRAVEFSVQNEKTLMQWVLKMLSDEGKKITKKDMELFLSKVGTDMGNIYQETQKLLAYTIGRNVVAAKDIEAVCVTQLTNKIFDMVRAVADRNQKKALELYEDLLALKEPPMRILFLLARQFRHLMQTKEMLAEGKGQQEIGRTLGVPGFAAKNYINCARGYDLKILRDAVEDFTCAEEDVKNGRLGDTLSVELLIIQYSRACG
ncbi:MAG: DNA polymerase III subunit delta [Lachnospiraceae bacterium]|jgi:DNA polymerase-3 subunit delta|nr:DNA polymerase III subunit delta [Lachnospiraceae bacterium]